MLQKCHRVNCISFIYKERERERTEFLGKDERERKRKNFEIKVTGGL